jgi:cell division transport system permease protein
MVAAALVLLVIGNRVGALGSELLGSAGLPLTSWMVLIALPIAGVFLAMLVARTTILRALSQLL